MLQYFTMVLMGSGCYSARDFGFMSVLRNITQYVTTLKNISVPPFSPDCNRKHISSVMLVLGLDLKAKFCCLGLSLAIGWPWPWP